jgi:hypothetical protein
MHQFKARTHRFRATAVALPGNDLPRTTMVRHVTFLHTAGTTFASVGAFCAISGHAPHPDGADL